jgi:hypothetical protein
LFVSQQQQQGEGKAAENDELFSLLFYGENGKFFTFFTPF